MYVEPRNMEFAQTWNSYLPGAGIGSGGKARCRSDEGEAVAGDDLALGAGEDLAGVSLDVPNVEVVASLRVRYLEIEGDAPVRGELGHAHMIEDPDEALLACARIGDRDIAH